MIKKLDIRKLKYIKGAIEGGMSDEKIIEWLEKNKYSITDLYQIIKIILTDRNNLIKKIESN